MRRSLVYGVAGAALALAVALTLLGVGDDPDALTIAEYGWGLNHSMTGIMLTANVARGGCAGNWFLRFVPGMGVTGAWFYPGRNATLSTLVSWDDVTGRGILAEFSYEEGASGLNRAPFCARTSA